MSCVVKAFIQRRQWEAREETRDGRSGRKLDSKLETECESQHSSIDKGHEEDHLIVSIISSQGFF